MEDNATAVQVPWPGVIKLRRLAGYEPGGHQYDDLVNLRARSGAAEPNTCWWPQLIEVYRPFGEQSSVQRLRTTYRKEQLCAGPLGHALATQQVEDNGEVISHGLQPDSLVLGPNQAITHVWGSVNRAFGCPRLVHSINATISRRDLPPGDEASTVNVPANGRGVCPQPEGTFSFRAPEGFGVCGLWGRSGFYVDALSVYYACHLPAWAPETHRLYPAPFKAAVRALCLMVKRYEMETSKLFSRDVLHLLLERLARGCYFEFESAAEAGWAGDAARSAAQGMAITYNS